MPRGTRLGNRAPLKDTIETCFLYRKKKRFGGLFQLGFVLARVSDCWVSVTNRNKVMSREYFSVLRTGES
jgi:hypothetical protein